MLSRFYPDECRESVYTMDFEGYYQEGYKGILFDIDNTLVPHGAPSQKKAEQLFEKLRKIGFDTCLISNNKEPRVKPFADAVKSKYIFNAHKPSAKNYIKAMKIMCTMAENTLFVGDQIFTDVYGAKKAGIHSVLVKPIHPKEEIQIVLKRKLEKIVLISYNRHLNKV
ncbi:MAG: YqeG family HAD IIIA-type phosphatase [Lachnospiraceae bacterium]|nr:YqeG family HAD IIIA-type phosphatase [Lachnospiraceae bacterium]